MIISNAPTTKTYHLQTDPEGVATVTFRQANNGDNMKLAKLGEKQAWRDGELGREVVTTFNFEETKRLQVRMTLSGSENILDSNNVPVFTFREGVNGPEIANADAFNKVWDMLPENVANEFYEFCLDLNPQWDPLTAGK